MYSTSEVGFRLDRDCYSCLKSSSSSSKIQFHIMQKPTTNFLFRGRGEVVVPLMLKDGQTFEERLNEARLEFIRQVCKGAMMCPLFTENDLNHTGITCSGPVAFSLVRNGNTDDVNSLGVSNLSFPPEEKEKVIKRVEASAKCYPNS